MRKTQNEEDEAEEDDTNKQIKVTQVFEHRTRSQARQVCEYDVF